MIRRTIDVFGHSLFSPIQHTHTQRKRKTKPKKNITDSFKAQKHLNFIVNLLKYDELLLISTNKQMKKENIYIVKMKSFLLLLEIIWSRFFFAQINYFWAEIAVSRLCLKLQSTHLEGKLIVVLIYLKPLVH